MKCNICQKSKKKLYKCQECNQLFCSECGETARNMCEFCIRFEENQRDTEEVSSQE